MEGQQLQRDDAQDALQAVHAVRHFDGAAGVLDGLVVVFVADHDGATLQREKNQPSSCESQRERQNMKRLHASLG